MINVLGKLSDGLVTFSKWLVIVLVALMASIIFTQVLLREFFNGSLLWAEEVTRFMFVWVTYFGASIALRIEGKHIGISVLRNKLPADVKKWVMLFTYVLMLAVVVFMLYHGWAYAILNLKFLSGGLRIPLFYPKMGIVIAFAFMFVHLLYKTCATVAAMTKRGESR